VRPLIIAALLAAAAVPALADTSSGTIVAYDRVANILVLNDKTVWSLGTLKNPPEGLAAERIITIDFTTAGDSGWARINSVCIKG